MTLPRVGTYEGDIGGELQYRCRAGHIYYPDTPDDDCPTCIELRTSGEYPAVTDADLKVAP